MISRREIMSKTYYCNKHSELTPLFPCKIFDGITVGYYCVSCDDFVPTYNPEIGVIKRLFGMCRKTQSSVRRKIACVQ
jgi:hypothetical protein